MAEPLPLEPCMEVPELIELLVTELLELLVALLKEAAVRLTAALRTALLT